jgi:hypothetical protein
VGADQEEFILLDCTHGDLCKIDVDSPAYGAIRGSIKDTLNSARVRMMKIAEGQEQSPELVSFVLNSLQKTFPAGCLG